MSLFGSMTTAIAGLGAQARALGHVSDNLANSQTVGFKRVDTNFQDLVTQSGPGLHAPGSVLARPTFTHSVQGTIEQSQNPIGMAIGGQGFFSVAQARGFVDGLPTFDDRQFFTRAGDFRMDRDGFLVNGANYFLQGWPVDDANVVDRTRLEPMRTIESGEAQVTDANSNGVGKLVVGALERSNVDIATEFTKLIVAQRAYTANTRVVTTSDEIMQETINMRR